VFPKAYGPVLLQLLDVMSARLRPPAAAAMLRESARRLAGGLLEELAGLDQQRRVERVMELLGPMAELERDDGRLTLRGCGCPLAAVVTSHPQVCRLAAALLGDLLATPVQERCHRGDSPRCRFEISRSTRSRTTHAKPRARRG
jgi:predicted ArsR family transcriptional regulator